MAGRRQSMNQIIRIGKNNGFTLLELLLVIGIIAALTGLAVPYYQDYVSQSKNSIMRANLHTLKKALMEYKADVGSYPASIQLLTIPPAGKPKYLIDLPADPESPEIANWGYVQVNSGASYTLNVKYLILQ